MTWIHQKYSPCCLCVKLFVHSMYCAKKWLWTEYDVNSETSFKKYSPRNCRPHCRHVRFPILVTMNWYPFRCGTWIERWNCVVWLVPKLCVWNKDVAHWKTEATRPVAVSSASSRRTILKRKNHSWVILNKQFVFHIYTSFSFSQTNFFFVLCPTKGMEKHGNDAESKQGFAWGECQLASKIRGTQKVRNRQQNPNSTRTRGTVKMNIADRFCIYFILLFRNTY